MTAFRCRASRSTRHYTKLRHASDLHSPTLAKAYTDVPEAIYNLRPSIFPAMAADSQHRPRRPHAGGHVHSMQMKIRIFGHSLSPAACLYEQWSGRYDADGKTLYINDGIGYVGYPRRPAPARNHAHNPAPMFVTLSVAVTADGFMDDRMPRRLLVPDARVTWPKYHQAPGRTRRTPRRGRNPAPRQPGPCCFATPKHPPSAHGVECSPTWRKSR